MHYKCAVAFLSREQCCTKLDSQFSLFAFESYLLTPAGSVKKVRNAKRCCHDQLNNEILVHLLSEPFFFYQI